jgi:hypothetical protein
VIVNNDIDIRVLLEYSIIVRPEWKEQASFHGSDPFSL